MTAGRRGSMVPPSDNDIRLIIQEAQTRWLRPQEVCEILKNYKQHNFKLNPVPPQTPQSGSLFLFDRKALRYFRKDGHNWRKKKDGKTVREAHERLKAGSIDVLHCYYAHGEDNPNFQRRAYWMLEPAHEHIVLVHYREVTEGNRLLMRPQEHVDRSLNAANPTPPHSQPTPFSHGSYSSLHMPNSMASPETVEMAAASHSPELEEAESADPEDLEEGVADVIGDQQQGLQPSLLEQLTDRPLAPSMNRPGGETWESGFRKANSGGVDGHMDAGLYMPQGDFKPSFPSLPLQQRAPSLPNFHQSGGMSTISRLEDLLDSPGTSYNPHQGNTSSNSMDLSGWNNLLENGRGSGGLGSGGTSFVKQELNSPSPWEAMLAQVTTPATRRTLLQGAGLAQPSPLGRDNSSHSVGLPVSPKGKGIADALSPRNLGREPQTALEADLRTVSERIVLKEAEDKKHQAQRSRWVMPGSESNAVDSSNQQMQPQFVPKPQQNSMFGEPDTLSALVRPYSQPQQQQQQQPPPPQLQQQPQAQQQLRNPPAVQNMNQYEQHGNQGQLNFPREDSKLHVLTSAPLQNNGFMDSPGMGMFSPTIESLLKDVRSDAEGGNLNNMDSFKKFGSFGKLDSFGRWMNNAEDISEISSMAPSSGSLWYPADPEDGMSGVSQVMEGLTPSVSLSEQLLNIIDFSPDWGFSTEETKVIISVSSVKAPSTNQNWHCMFGIIEVPAEVLGEGSLRCKAPHQESGTVPFYITRGDRQACSQVREFEYRAPVSLPDELISQTLASQSEVDTKDEMLLKIRLARMLFGHESAVNNGRSGNRTAIFDESDDDEWRCLETMVNTSAKPLREIKELLLENIFKHKLEEWLISKMKPGEGKSPSVLDDRGQGVPHFMAALGYDWSVIPIFAAGVAKNFRDDSGWTALHWAAKSGREKTVVALIEAGAAPSLTSYPSHKNPRGVTAADLASAGGHGGIAGFLAEKALTERLSSMTLNDEFLNEIDKMTANMEGEKAVAWLARRTSIVRSVQEPGDEKILETSLKAVRSSTHTGALLQSAYRLQSFRRREEAQHFDDFDEYGLTPAQVEDLGAARKIQQAFRGHHQKNKMKQHLAATRIQQKYRGWKGRKEYQTMRQRIIKIQAHVRGKLVRRKYRKIVWSVSIVEKVVLRWLRKRKGLRGYQPSREIEETIDDNEDLTKEGRQAQKEFVQMDVNKVVTMARQKCDRDQYLRLVVEEKRTSASKGELNDEVADYLSTPRDNFMD